MEEPFVDTGHVEETEHVEEDTGQAGEVKAEPGKQAEEKLADLVNPTKVVESGDRLETLIQDLTLNTDKQNVKEESEQNGKADDDEESGCESNESDLEGSEQGDPVDEVALSVHISADDRAQFEDVTNGNNQATKTCSPGATEDGESITAHSLLSEDDAKEDTEEEEEEEELFERKSDLHCALCGELCSDGRLLKCLHTFCLHCLERKDKERFKFIFCPLCRTRTKKPKDGLQELPENLVVSNLTAVQAGTRVRAECVVCGLVGEEQAATARCVDCGDLLCQDCSSKHTYSRHTAKHTVMKLEGDTDSGESPYFPMNRVVHCPTHRDEEMKFYCSKCQKAVCRDCVLLSHSSHECVDLNDAFEKMKCHLCQNITEMKEKSDDLKDEDYEMDLSLVEVEEKQQVKQLEDAKAEITDAIEIYFNKCLKQLEEGFDKKREYCLIRKQYVEKMKQGTRCLEVNSNFIMNYGSAAEVIAMEKTLAEAFSSHINHIKGVFPTLQKIKDFPKAVIHNDKVKQVRNLSWCNIVTKSKSIDSQKSGASGKTSHVKVDRDKQAKGARDHQGMGDRDKQSKGARDQQAKGTRDQQGKPRHTAGKKPPFNVNVSNNASRPMGNNSYRGQQHTAPKPLLTSQEMAAGRNMPPVGRGRYLQGYSTGSLLGEYPGYLTNTGPTDAKGFGSRVPHPGMRNAHGQSDRYEQGAQGYKFHQDSSSSKQHSMWPDKGASQMISKGGKHPNKDQAGFMSPRGDMLVPSMKRDLLRMRLQTSVKVSVLLEQYDAEVAGIAFTTREAFAITDYRNKRVKLFDVRGKFLTVVEDPDPMGLTVCKDHLIWNSNYANIMIYSLSQLTTLDCRRFSPHAVHPVATFKGEKLLVANVQGSTIEAYRFEGGGYKWLHSLQPVDGRGQPLQKVSQIAAFARDHLAIVDRALKKVVITNFDGRFIGEFSCEGWEPCGICIDHRDNIFVTDRACNKLIALTGTGEFIQEWKTMVDLPSAVAANGHGQLIVAGRGSNVSVYVYE